MKALKRFKATMLLILALGATLAWITFSQQAARHESPVDAETYRTTMERQIRDTTDLEALIRDERWFYEVITPPVDDFVLRQPMAHIIPFDWKHFPENLPELLADRYQYEYSVPVYKLRAVEDRRTRQLHFYDGKERLFSIPAPVDYDPFAVLKSRYPGLYSGRYALSKVRAMEAQYDPARIELLVTLIPTDYVEPYLYAQGKVREYQMSLREKEEDGGFMLLGMGTESNIVITAMTHTSNGMELVIGYPDTFTNRLDVYRSTDLVEMDWQQVASALATTGTNQIDWVDTGYDTGT